MNKTVKELSAAMQRVFQLAGLSVLTVSALVTQAADETRSPVGKLLDPEGTVEYSRDGDKWRPVTRAKYVFEGYQVKTGADGSTSFVNQNSGMAQRVGSNSLVIVTADGIDSKSGDVSDPFSTDGGLIASLENKFASAQRYTTVRRAVVKPGEPTCERNVRLAGRLAVAEGFTDLVWDVSCPGDQYRLTIGDQVIAVPSDAASESLVRYRLPKLEAGEYDIQLEVVEGDAVVYSPRRPATLTVLDDVASEALAAQVEACGDDLFAQADVLSEQGVLVGALDAQARYFAEYPDDFDMKPLYIAQLQALRLQTLRESEAVAYNAYISGEGAP